MLNISDIMKIINFSETFIKSLIIKIFWCNKCQTRGLKVFWVHPQNQNLSKLNISCPQNVQPDKKTLSPIIKTTILFPLKQTHICPQYLKMRQLRPKFYNAWNLKWKRSLENDCKFLCNILIHSHFLVRIRGVRKWSTCLSMPPGLCSTGWERLIQSHSSARFSFELSGNSN